MAQFKKYRDIERFKEKFADCIEIGDLIHCSEKIDGSNFSITYSPEKDEVVCFSRNKQLTPENNLRGAYEYAMSIPKDIVKHSTLNGRYVLFGEWLVKNKISYPEEKYNRFYLFDIWDNETQSYCSQTQVSITAHTMRMQGVPISEPKCFYFGKFEGWDKIFSLVGKTAIGAMPCGEGIVVKNQSKLTEQDSYYPNYIKIVSEKFSEVQKQKVKKIDLETLSQLEKDRELAMTIITERRIEKLLQKMIDDGELIPDWDEKQLGFIAKNLIYKVYQDCLKEEKETVEEIKNFSKLVGKITMEIVRGMI